MNTLEHYKDLIESRLDIKGMLFIDDNKIKPARHINKKL